MTLRSTDEILCIAQALSHARRRSAQRLDGGAEDAGHLPIVWRLSTLVYRHGRCFYVPEGGRIVRLMKTGAPS